MTLHQHLAVLAALAALAAAALPTAVPAQDGAAFELITASEAEREQQAASPTPEAPRTRAMPALRSGGGPVIRVLAPPAGGALTAPIRIELAFEPAPGARIVPASFRMLYGVLKIDLTERLRKYATVTETGVVIDRAQVPSGVHRLFLQVADDRGQQAEQELRLRVGAAS